MYKLACHDLGNQTCTFEASGDTEKEVAQMMDEHAKKTHADDLKGKSDEEWQGEMLGAVREG